MHDVLSGLTLPVAVRLAQLARLAGAAGILAVVVTSAGCRKTPASTTSSDGGADDASAPDANASIKPFTGPLEAHVVAHVSPYSTRLVDMQNGKVVIDAGLFVYELVPGGTTRLLGDVASYAKQLPKDDDEIGGYDVAPLPYMRKLELPPPFTTRDPHDVRGDEARYSDADPSWSIGKEIDLPPGFEADQLARVADGRTIVVGRPSRDEPQVTLVAAKGSRSGKVVTIVDIGDAPNGRIRCAHVASWGSPHLYCEASNGSVLPTIHRLAGDRWERVKRTEQAKSAIASVAVGYDDTLWLGFRENEVMRITKAGAIDSITIPKSETKVVRATYHTSESYGAPAAPGKPSADLDERAEGARRWESMNIASDEISVEVERITQIVPQADGEAWVLGDARGITVVAHLGRPAMAPIPAPITVGSPVDQRNEVRNTRPPKPWVGHCAQLFVPIAKQRPDGSFDAAAAWAKKEALRSLLEKVRAAAPNRGERPQAALVEGTLHGRRAAGVLVWRYSPAASEEIMEKMANALGESQAKSAGLPPDITCSAPVLQRAELL